MPNLETSNLENSTVATGLEKVSFHSDPKERQCKECSNYHIIALISSKIMLKILQARFQQYVNRELPHAQTGFRKGRGARDQAANISWIIEKAKKFRITSTSASLTTLKPLTVWITKNCRIFLKRWEYQNMLPVSWETGMQVEEATVRTGCGTMNWFDIGKGVHQGCILALCLFNLYAGYIMWNARLDKAQAAIKISGRNMNNLI